MSKDGNVDCSSAPDHAHSAKLDTSSPNTHNRTGKGGEVLRDHYFMSSSEQAATFQTRLDLNSSHLAIIAASVPDGASNIQDVCPLSALQEGMLFHRLLNERSDTYVLSILFELESDHHVAQLKTALQMVIDRHDALRTAVLWEGLPTPLQVVYRRAALPISTWTMDPDQEAVEQCRERMRPGNQPLDVRTAPLVRLEFAADANGHARYAVLYAHHIVCDHQSLGLVVAEVLAIARGRAHELPPTGNYARTIEQAWQQSNLGQAETFFSGQLGDLDTPCVPFGLSDVHGDGSQLDESHAVIDSLLSERIRTQARRCQVRPARLFHAAWSLVMARTSGVEDVVFGTVLLVRGPKSAALERTLAMSVNTLPLRLRLSGRSVRHIVEQTDRALTDVIQHAQAPLSLAQRCTSTAPLFTALFNFRHSASDPTKQVDGTSDIRVVARGEAWSNYPISMTVDDLGRHFELACQADRRIGPRRMTEYLLEALRSLTDALEHAPDTQALALSVLPQRERHQVLQSFNAAVAPYPPDKLIHQLFEEQALRTPDAIAVVSVERSLTFAELNTRANQLARYLRRRGIGPNATVGICVGRSPEMVVGLLGTLKAGGAYVPFDPDYPAERLTYMLQDAAPTVLLTEHGSVEKLSTAAERIVLDHGWRQFARERADNLDGSAVGSHSDDLAYVIYTSGSTGRPKGVMVQHRHVLNLWTGLERLYRESQPCTRVAWNASINFDASVQQLIQLLSGRTLYLVPASVRRDVRELLAFLIRHDIHGFDCTPSQLKALVSAGLLTPSSHAIRLVLVGGESIDPPLWRALAAHPQVHFYNVYGPTECTVDATVCQLSADDELPHIGRPMENRRCYILDRHAQPVPIGVSGELFIGGTSVGRGYLGQPQLTAERFFLDPFSDDPRDRMYRTGDIAQWLTNGTILYQGRNDDQVKIRGFRIELEEIRTQLLTHAAVEEAAVLVREDVPGAKQLVAYLVPKASPGSDAPTLEELRHHLRAMLPEHMIPSAFVILKRMPLTANGKLNRLALPPPDRTAYLAREYQSPQGQIEQLLADVWQSLLKVEKVGRADNFFELGGHSLLILQMLERLRRVGLSTEVRAIFESPTLADLAHALRNAAISESTVPPNRIPPGCTAITPQMLPLIDLTADHITQISLSMPGGAANIQDIYPLAPLQEGILFHHLLNDRRGDTYVVPILLHVASKVRLQELIAAVQTVIDRHDVLRTAVLWEQLPQPLQVVYRSAQLPVQEHVLDPDRDPLAQVQEWLKPQRQRIDLHIAPLMRLHVAEGPSGTWYAMLLTHHITSDHVTLEIVIAEVVAHLQGRDEKHLSAIRYRDHVAQALAHDKAHDATAFFRRKLADVTEPTAPFGLIDVHGDGAEVREASAPLPEDLAKRVRTQARRRAVSAATLFHAAWALVVAHTSGQDNVVFGSVLLGRLQGSAGRQQTLGMFINTLPLRLPLRGANAEQFVQTTQRELLDLLGHEQASLAAAQRCSGISGSAPLFTSLFNYRHSVPDPAKQWTGAAGIQVLAVQERTNYPITFSVDDLGEGFALTAQTDPRIDPHRAVAYLRTAIAALVDALDNAPHTLVSSLPVLPNDERDLVINRFNDTSTSCSQEKVVHELFEEQVARTPHARALSYGGRSLTYAELNARANQLARYLRARDVHPGQFVGLCMHRSFDMIVGVLAILKADAAYVPLDPNYPTERLRIMLEAATPRVVLSQRDLKPSLPAFEGKVIAIDALSDELQVFDAANLDGTAPRLEAQSPLYVIFTSGSTGRPKGTAMPHRAMINLLEWHLRALPLRPGTPVLQFAPLSFDVAFQETFSTLCAGGTLVLLGECVRRDAHALLDLIQSESVERLFIPPLMLQTLAEYAQSTGDIALKLRDVITAGEQLCVTTDMVKFFGALRGCRLSNHYGPTETHVVTALTLAEDPRTWPTLPSIGKPIANVRMYVLDEHQRPVAIGVAGELYIAGECLGSGYVGRPELTAARFLADPFTIGSDRRMYKTGDLARWHTDGTLEYLGRNDDQVKIRGYRIELAEVEAQLALHAQVREAAVVAREVESGHKRLIAYFTCRDDRAPSAEELRAHLKALLPEHMVPSAFMLLDSFPVTPSGKMNRRALPAPELEALGSAEGRLPQGAIEEALAEIWQDVLRVQPISREDNFFEVGGHSLLALKALLKINQCFGTALRITEMYKSPTIAELAARISVGVADEELIDLSVEARIPDLVTASIHPRHAEPATVLLTGATGFVGRFLLAQLLEDTDATVYCLVRAPDEQQARSRLRATSRKWDLCFEQVEQRLIAIPGDLRAPKLGLSDARYCQLAEQVDTLYHCAAQMNHLETYRMAKAANADSTAEMLRFAGRERPKLINYISTLGVFNAVAADPKRVVNEQTPIDFERHTASGGHFASKWVAEKILMRAGDAGIASNIFRLGLIWADTEQGRFDELQQTYRLLKSCLLSGYGIQGYQYPMPPTPVDYVTRAAVFLANQHPDGGAIFHLSSANQPSEGVFERCNRIAGTSLTLLPYYEWICKLKGLHEAGRSLPAVPLVEFAFTMDERAFNEHQRALRSAACIDFDLTQTHRALDQARIIAPEIDDVLLRLTIEDMCSRDPDLQHLRRDQKIAMVANRRRSSD